MEVYIDNSITEVIEEFDIIVLKMDIKLEDSNKISELITHYENKISEEYSLEEILNIPLIKEARDGYKKLGKDPSRYRLACESLLRRIVKGNKLYKINNIVDAGNILSIEANRSVAVLDYDKIEGDVLIRLGNENDEYYGIGRGKINVSNIPLYCDKVGPFGSTTSDTERTMITDDTKTILLFIICFGPSMKEEHKTFAISLFEKYGSAQNISNIKVRK